MEQKKILKKIRSALQKTFPDIKIKEDISKLEIGSFKKWDSLGHLNLLLEIEREFKLNFQTSVFSKIKSIKDIIKEIK